MSTIDKLAKIDNIATRIILALRRGVEWVEDKYEDCLVDATYKAVELKAAAIYKAEDKISELEDAGAALAVRAAEAAQALTDRYHIALDALKKETATKQDKLDTELAAAAEARVAAGKAYHATIRAANEKLGVEVDA